jgi:hypothetical protein
MEILLFGPPKPSGLHRGHPCATLELLARVFLKARPRIGPFYFSTRFYTVSEGLPQSLRHCRRSARSRALLISAAIRSWIPSRVKGMAAPSGPDISICVWTFPSDRSKTSFASVSLRFVARSTMLSTNLRALVRRFLSCGIFSSRTASRIRVNFFGRPPGLRVSPGLHGMRLASWRSLFSLCFDRPIVLTPLSFNVVSASAGSTPNGKSAASLGRVATRNHDVTRPDRRDREEHRDGRRDGRTRPANSTSIPRDPAVRRAACMARRATSTATAVHWNASIAR